ncbi:MAG: hypothetical protein JHD28_11325, partial [Bacteroidia bacterium]|nr:hypothetical protein [Bacteroidia bacterium]
MKKIIQTITLAITATVLLGLNQVNAQVQKPTNIGSNAALNPIHFVLQQNNGSSNLTSLGKKAPKFMLDSMSELGWNSDSNTFSVGPWVRKYIYDANGNNILQILSSVNYLTQQLMPTEKHVNTFNKNNKIITKTQSYYILDSNKWENYVSMEWAYDSKGNNIIYRERILNQITHELEPYNTYSYTFNDSNKVTVEIDTNYSNSTPTIYKKDYSYDTNGNNILITRYLRTGTQWQISQKEEFTYDANNNNTSQTLYNWNSKWVFNLKFDYTIDGNGNATTVNHYNWDDASNQWLNSFKYEYNYNNAINFNEVACEIINFGNLIPLIKHP